nr:ThiS [Erythrocladia irregularis]
MKITVEINGEPFNCMNNMSLSFLLEYLDFNISISIIEYNSNILSKDQIQYIQLKDQDKLEVVTIVGGG